LWSVLALVVEAEAEGLQQAQITLVGVAEALVVVSLGKLFQQALLAGPERP
jgi:hypothetical protein